MASSDEPNLTTSPTAVVAADAVETVSSEEKHHRSNSIEKHLQTRPDKEDLVNRHILLDTKAAPALQSAEADLKRQQATDSLRKNLASRPEREELVERNILPSSTAAPALIGHQKQLERHMRKDSLEKHLQERPTAEVLKEKGILTDESSVQD